jgi:hypothetical protein
MERYNNNLRDQLKDSWKQVFDRVFDGDKPGSRPIPQDFDQAFRDLYGYSTFLFPPIPSTTKHMHYQLMI